MWYVGSKNRISKDLAPIIQSYITDETKGYIEPFVGGANMIDKIVCDNKIGCDIYKELIALLQYAQNNELPETITEEEYNTVRTNKSNYKDWYVGLVGFCASFGAKYFGGYARGYNKDGSIFDVPRQAINSLRKQSKSYNFKTTKFIHCSFLDIPKEKIKGYVIYCDIPYKGTTKYTTTDFPYDEFYKWANEMAKYNTVLISEYNMLNNCCYLNYLTIYNKNKKKGWGSRIIKYIIQEYQNIYLYSVIDAEEFWKKNNFKEISVGDYNYIYY